MSQSEWDYFELIKSQQYLMYQPAAVSANYKYTLLQACYGQNLVLNFFTILDLLNNLLENYSDKMNEQLRELLIV